MNERWSLENLRDLVEPEPVPWWPPAPGWWILIALILIGLAIAAFSIVRRWRANAYRRAAILEIGQAASDAKIVQILKRAAICADSGPHIRALSGADWSMWLGETGGDSVPDEIAERISVGVYRDGSRLTPSLADYARRWISRHRIDVQEERERL